MLEVIAKPKPAARVPRAERRVRIRIKSAPAWRQTEEASAVIRNPQFAAARYLRSSVNWSQREADFLHGMANRSSFAGALSAKQSGVMRALAARFVGVSQ